MKEHKYEDFECLKFNYKERDCIKKLVDFVNSDNCHHGKIMALYGLRRTGKSVLLEQTIVKSKFKKEECAFWTTIDGDTIDTIDDKIQELVAQGKKLIVIDEITRTPDFMNNSAFFADVYAKSGIRILLSGTDSLGFVFASEHELYDRMDAVSTTYISFAEHSRVLRTTDIDNYIAFGGLMQKGLAGDEVTTYDEAVKYLDSAVAGNIVHSMKNYDRITMKKCLINSVPENEIVSIIEKLVEDYSGLFDLKRITKEFSTATITEPLDHLEDSIKSRMKNFTRQDRKTLGKQFLHQINADQQITVEITEEMVNDFDLYLGKMGFLSTVLLDPIEYNASEGEYILGEGNEKYIIQPAIKYHHLTEGIKFIKNKILALPNFANFGPIEKKDIEEKMSENLGDYVKGLMMEQIIAFNMQKIFEDTKIRVSKTQFYPENLKKAEFDIAVCDLAKKIHWAIEVKHSKKLYDNAAARDEGEIDGQDVHLLNSKFTAETEKFYGKRMANIVLYNGNLARTENNTLYINAAEFLINLDKTKDMEKTVEHFEKQLENIVQSEEKQPVVSITPEEVFDSLLEKSADRLFKGESPGMAVENAKLEEFGPEGSLAKEVLLKQAFKNEGLDGDKAFESRVAKHAAEMLENIHDGIFDGMGVSSASDLDEEKRNNYKKSLGEELSKKGVLSVPKSVRHVLQEDNYHTLLASLPSDDDTSQSVRHKKPSRNNNYDPER